MEERETEGVEESPLNLGGGIGPFEPGITDPLDGGEVDDTVTSGWRLAVRSFAENKLAIVGLGILIFFVLFCYVGPHVYHSNQISGNVLNSDLPPGSGHPLGTDNNGYDELGRLMVGGQAALEIGFFAAIIATVIGSLYGAISGLIGGLLDGVMMRIVDVILSIPYLLIVLIVATRYSGTVLSLSLILGLFAWLVPARLIRGEVLSLRVRDFVSAAKVMGSGRTRLIFRHLLPNALSVVIVNITFQVADAIIAIALLGFLGFGLQYPHVDWGDMLSTANTALGNGYWWLVYPVGISLILVVMACNFIGNALRDSVDVRLRRR
ncbi:peptide/nickel transport system permease protein [Ferrithrix thermotolerans DSM 19514]|uniref:Peptide/nickel transport system permease protein n=1 Tax=Ferrithrix thermotolerans DSM 19514 TaxID=1121881 RepID=A0A1M4U9H6_9ACTN|nr:ABC transporter permease [Ferrithrix thermotolerans]SHE53286.1 peptide/nickel transport system permease protein [Ferrithrix thermotolerans DSM 19514]